MPHITLQEGVPGIRSLVMYRPDTGKHLYDLAQVLLRDDSPLTTAERELIATYVSYKNECQFCRSSHAAAARYLYKDEAQTVDLVLDDYKKSPISKKLKALLTIAGKVQKDARTVTPKDVALARKHGAGDRDIHDTVLIAATFCMFNRYVDGLGTLTPTDPNDYVPMGERMGTWATLYHKNLLRRALFVNIIRSSKSGILNLSSSLRWHISILIPPNTALEAS